MKKVWPLDTSAIGNVPSVGLSFFGPNVFSNLRGRTEHARPTKNPIESYGTRRLLRQNAGAVPTLACRVGTTDSAVSPVDGSKRRVRRVNRRGATWKAVEGHAARTGSERRELRGRFERLERDDDRHSPRRNQHHHHHNNKRTCSGSHVASSATADLRSTILRGASTWLSQNWSWFGLFFASASVIASRLSRPPRDHGHYSMSGGNSGMFGKVIKARLVLIAPVVQDGEGGGRRPEEDDPSVQLRIEVPAVAIAVELLLHLAPGCSRDQLEIQPRRDRRHA